MFKKVSQFYSRVKILNNLVLVLFILFASFGLNSKLNAQDVSAFGIVIDEIKFDLTTLAPGSSITKSFNVTHDYQDENKQVTLYTKALDFTSDNVSGTPKFLPTGTLSPKASLASWIKVDKSSINLSKKGQKELVTFTITVPQDAEPGGKYAAVLLTEQPNIDEILSKNPNTQNLALTKQIGPIVLLTIGGDIKKELSLESIHTEDINAKKTTFFFNTPVSFVSNIKNTGNVHLIPKGDIYIYKGSDHNKFVAKLDLNAPKSYTLPNSTRVITNTWDESFINSVKEKDASGKEIVKTVYDWNKLSKLRIGKYNAKIIYSYDGESQTHEMTLSFWVIPLGLIILVGGILALITLIILYKVYKKKNKKKSDDFKL
jgi:hypothetical protein